MISTRILILSYIYKSQVKIILHHNLGQLLVRIKLQLRLEKNEDRWARRIQPLAHVPLHVDDLKTIFIEINRYKRGLETFPQAKTFKSGREYFLLFFSDASERRV